MPLTLVLGPANSAKAGEVLGAYAVAAAGGALLVVPTVADAEQYSRELAGQDCVLGSVVTFAGLAEEVARRAGYIGRRVSAAQRERVVHRAVQAVRLRVLGASARSPGFEAAAGELIAELERSLVDAARFGAAMRSWAADDPRRLPYAEDVAAIYLQYVRELERLRRVDRELHLWRSLDALRRAPECWGSTPVYLYGFDDLHPLERDGVETLARAVGAEVVVSLTYEAGRSALSARAHLVAELREIAERVVELPAVESYYAAGSRAALHHLERSLFESGSARKAINPGSAVRLLEAAGERAEAELVAAEVLRLLREGVPGEEIAVVYRSLTGRGASIARVLAGHGIDVALARRVPFGHTPLGRGLLAFLRCAMPTAGAQDLLAYVRTPGVIRRPEIADSLELAIRREGLRSARKARGQLRWEVSFGGDLVGRGRELLAAPRRGSAAVLDRDEELDALALAAMGRLLSELAELGEEPSGAELLDLLEGLELTVGGGARAGAVLLTEPLPIRARRFRVVFVCGLQEGEWPRAPSPEPFLSDERRRELATASGLRLRLQEEALERDRYLFYACLSRATEQVLLSYRSSDEEGNLEQPSPFLSDVADLFDDGWRERRRRRLLADVVWPAAEAPTERERARSRAAGEAPAAGEASPRYTLSAAARAHVRHTEVVSAAALEAYAECPLKWLVERELQPARFEPESDALVRGSYMHRVLEEVIRGVGGAVTPESLPRAIALLEEAVAEISPSIAPSSAEGVRRGVAEAIAADLRRYLRHEASEGCGWSPRSLELRFGFEDEQDSLPPLVLVEDGARVAVRGAIDRVDVDPRGSRAIVRDYKSGTARPEHQGARWREDQRLQVALYMLAVRELLGLEPVAGLYQPLGGRDLRARGLFVEGECIGPELVGTDARERAELDQELSDAAARAVELARRLRAGELVPSPATCAREGCRYPAICRSG